MRSTTEIADHFNLSSHAVNMRWRTIFNRIDAHPELSGLVLRPDRHRDGKAAAGHHKRRRVVTFVRAHPEELRPYAESGFPPMSREPRALPRPRAWRNR